MIGTYRFNSAWMRDEKARGSNLEPLELMERALGGETFVVSDYCVHSGICSVTLEGGETMRFSKPFIEMSAVRIKVKGHDGS